MSTQNTDTSPSGSEQLEFRDPDKESPWWLLNFYLELPFYMPYLTGAKFNVALTQHRWAEPVPDGVPAVPFVLLELVQRSAPPPPDPSVPMQWTLQDILHRRGTADMKSFFDGDLQVTPHPLHIVSVVEAVTPKVMLQAEVDAGLPHHPTTYLERCLAAFNVWIRSIAVATRRPSIRTVARENLPMWLAFFHQLPNDGAIVHCDALRAHENPTISPNSIATKHVAEKIQRIASSIDDSHGVVKAAEWHHTALRLASVEGRYDLAIVAINTALEVFVFGLARVLLVDDGATTAEIDNEVGGALGVATVCHRFIEPRIGGRWDRTDVSCPLGEVTERVVDVRNKVAHQGLSVSSQQIGPAFSSYGRFIEFVTRQVAGKRWRFQRTFMDLVNAFGVPAGLTVGARFSHAASAIVEATPRYWLPAQDDRQTADPPALVDGSPGVFPPTAGAEKAAHWESTTTEPFMHLVLRHIVVPSS